MSLPLSPRMMVDCAVSLQALPMHRAGVPVEKSPRSDPQPIRLPILEWVFLFSASECALDLDFSLSCRGTIDVRENAVCCPVSSANHRTFSVLLLLISFYAKRKNLAVLLKHHHFAEPSAQDPTRYLQ